MKLLQNIVPRVIKINNLISLPLTNLGVLILIGKSVCLHALTQLQYNIQRTTMEINHNNPLSGTLCIKKASLEAGAYTIHGFQLLSLHKS